MNELVKLAIDARNGSVEKYSVADANEALRQALIEANGGDTKLDIRRMRDNGCGQVFALVEEILKNVREEGFKDDSFFNELVDFRNVAEGDEIIFEIEDATLLYVDSIAQGTQALRRQRLSGSHEIAIPTILHGVRIYEELRRVLAGRVDFMDMIDKVDKSVKDKIYNEIYKLWIDATDSDLGGAEYFPAVGAYNEATLLQMIEHVEAAAGGKTATIIGTKAALRPLMANILATADKAKEDMYDMGYVGKFYGAPVIMVPQRHVVGSNKFAFNDKVLTVVAAGEKPIKFVYEGSPLIIPRNPEDNMDLTQEYFFAEAWGSGIALAGNAGIGKYQFS